MSHTRRTQHSAVGQGREIADVIDEHRRRAHRTESIPEKIQLIRKMAELRRA